MDKKNVLCIVKLMSIINILLYTLLYINYYKVNICYIIAVTIA